MFPLSMRTSLVRVTLVVSVMFAPSRRMALLSSASVETLRFEGTQLLEAEAPRGEVDPLAQDPEQLD